MKTFALLITFIFTSFSSFCQQRTNDRFVGGTCEGCEAALEFGKQTLNAIDTLPDFNTNGPKILLTGTVFREDGKTPASDVILYIYHTNQEGIYPTKGGEKNWAKRHGYIRGWIKTKADGKYSFYTLRPGAYPGRDAPEHVHIIIKEPGLSPYYVDDFLFEDDPILTKAHRSQLRKRGGNGVIRLSDKKNGFQTGTRDIVLGLNIPDYH
jgi:protocatechuate 3,4-dioxygenase, beta subunit